MDKWTQDSIANQRVILQDKAARARSKWREIEVFNLDRRPSWKNYGEGHSRIKVSAIKAGSGGVPAISINAAETATASKIYDEKRDVTKEVFIQIDGPAAIELYEMLREVFEPTVDDPR